MSDAGPGFTLPDALCEQVERAAADEGTTPQEWVRRVVARRLDEQAWHDVLAYGEERAQALDLREGDVERLVAESRRERDVQDAAAAGRTGR